jgi:hypothetical protein
MSERTDVGSQEIRWDVDGIAVNAKLTRLAIDALAAIETWLAAQTGPGATEGQG